LELISRIRIGNGIAKILTTPNPNAVHTLLRQKNKEKAKEEEEGDQYKHNWV